MKIEPKHNYSKPAYAAAASILAAATLITGCGPQVVGEIQYSEPYSEPYTSQTSETLALEGDMVMYDCFPDRGLGENEIDLYTEGCDQYAMFMAKIQEVEDMYPGQYTFSITSVNDEARGGYFFVLTAWGPREESPVHMVLSSSRWVWYDDGGTLGTNGDASYSYEDILRLPFLFDTGELLHSELYETGVVPGCHTDMFEQAEDGLYCGRIIAVNEDSSSVIILIGEPITFNREETASLEPGDLIGLYDLRITEDQGDPGEDAAMINVEGIDLTDLYLTDSPFDSSELCLSGPDGIWIEDPVIVEVTISAEGDIELSPIHSDNGWTLVDVPTVSVEISGGDIVRIEQV